MTVGIYDLKTPNPYPAVVTDAQWWFWEQLAELEPGTELGGFYANKPGHHNTRRNLIAQKLDFGAFDPRTDYSIRRPVDRLGPDDKCSACDWSFPWAWSGDFTRSAKYGRRVKAAFDRRDSRLAGWREFLGQTDTDRSVAGEGLDFHMWTTRTPDSSHETHHHFSEDREVVGSFENKAKMISILAGYDSLAAWQAAKEDDMLTAADEPIIQHAVHSMRLGKSTTTLGQVIQPLPGQMTELLSVVRAVLASSTSDEDADAILAEIRRQGELTRAAVAGILDALPEGDGPVSREDLVAALTTVLGSVDGATPVS